MVLSVQCSDVRASQGTSTLVAEQAEASEVVSLAQGVLAGAVLVFSGEELGCDDRATVLQSWVSLSSRQGGLERGNFLHDI